jgi:hypothetical protein
MVIIRNERRQAVLDVSFDISETHEFRESGVLIDMVKSVEKAPRLFGTIWSDSAKDLHSCRVRNHRNSVEPTGEE